ncbi:hypothetical protein P3339_04985 [Microbulbifer sp. MLAF003]|uniref:hypothetical protein n=1 Tax=unclassified Microbulbifer TaxID=2619833 RepID=UPI0024ACAA55|nr:hypothetical protein [Microbulbifer sp. MLAF003]WHI52163.1 hypothetical protein P3339_04985 [Microbulbifer sp. MLAF003]
MSNKLTSLLQLIKDGKVIGLRNFKNLNIDFALDQRDDDPFDSDWVSANKSIGEKFTQVSLSQDSKDLIDEIREAAFKLTSKAVGVNEISEYVCDDFELIAKSIVVSSDNLWVAAMLKAYLDGFFPTGKLQPSSYTVNELINT